MRAAHSPAGFGCPLALDALGTGLGSVTLCLTFGRLFSLPQVVHLQNGDDAGRGLVVLRGGGSRERVQPRGRAHSPLGSGSGRSCSEDGGRRLWCAHSCSGRPCATWTQPLQATSPLVYKQLKQQPVATAFSKHGQGFVPARFQASLKALLRVAPGTLATGSHPWIPLGKLLVFVLFCVSR